LNQLNNPHGLYVDQTIYIADTKNHRIVEWKCGATTGKVVAGGTGRENQTNQLNRPTDVIVDERTDSLVICDNGNRRVILWSRQGGRSGQTVISDIDCYGLSMDTDGFLYISDCIKNEVRRWRVGETHGIVVAGGNGQGDRLDQLYFPSYVFVDRNQAVYVTDANNARVMKWVKGAKEGIVVSGGKGTGTALTQLSDPQGIAVDQRGTVYVADFMNNRVMRWPEGATQGDIIVGGHGKGEQANQLNGSNGLAFDRHGHLYVVEQNNHRVQKFQYLS
jgi:sugar lactone lactonase YvrE